MRRRDSGALLLTLALSGGARAEATPSAVVTPSATTAPSTASAPNPPAEKQLRLVERGKCPDAKSTAQHVAPLLRRHRISADDDGESVVATLSDEGARFRVVVQGTDRLVDEPGRDCLERARIAAVLIAMALEPPNLVTEEPAAFASAASAPPAPTPTSTALPASPSDGAQLSVSIEALALLGWGAAPSSLAPGIGPLVALRADSDGWLARYAVGFLPARELDVTAGSATLARVPMDLSVGRAWSFDALTLEAGLGIAADVLFVRAEDLDNRNNEVRFDVGPRAMFALAAGPPSVQGVAMLRAAWFPSNYQLFVNDVGKVGETPALWLELALGLRFDLR